MLIINPTRQRGFCRTLALLFMLLGYCGALPRRSFAAELPQLSTPAVEPAALEEFYINQPALAAPEFSAADAPASTARRSARSQYVRLARAPNMFGDSLNPGSSLLFRIENNPPGQTQQFAFDLPLGSGSNFKIAENNKALPMDRVYFVYNGFQNALQQTRSRPFAPPITSDLNVDRYTLGFEKTFFDGTASLEIRVPFVGGFNAGVGNSFALSSGNFGDLTLFSKQVLYQDDELVLAAGLGLSLPTASDLEGQINNVPLAINNGTVLLLPYIGFLTMPSENCFVQAFLELDFAASGNDIQIGNRAVGTYTPQHLFLANFSVGHWIYQNPDAKYLQRMAAIGELHYATTIQDADAVPIFGPGFNGALASRSNRVDYLNLTAGLQFQIGPLANLRVAGVVPLRVGFDRQFDYETQVSFNRFF